MSTGGISWFKRIGIGGRLFLAFVLISSITIVASGLATNTYLQLSERLLLLKHQDIPGLDAAARLNDKSRLIVATAPLLVTSDSNFSRLKAMEALSEAISEMDELMRNLPDYNRYFRELIAQIHNSLALLNQSVDLFAYLFNDIWIRRQHGYDLLLACTEAHTKVQHLTGLPFDAAFICDPLMKVCPRIF